MNPVLPFQAPIQRSAWKANSAKLNFRFTAFLEVRTWLLWVASCSLEVANPILSRARRTIPMPSDEQDKAGVIAPPALIYGLLLGRRFPMRFLPRTMARGLGWPLLGGGVLLLGWFEWAMRQADTPTSPYKPVERIATDAPFRYSRNPGYLAITLIYAGIASLANALWAILLLPVALSVIQRGVIEREERYLEGKFGEEYLSYKARVRRWI